MKKIISLIFFTSLIIPSAVLSHTAADPFVTDLIGGGGNVKSAMDVGDVLVWNDADNVYVKYLATEPWCITETHLQVGESLEMIPQRNGNPVPGQFDMKGIHDCAADFTIPISLNSWLPGTSLYIAAHAEVLSMGYDNSELIIMRESAWGAGFDFPGKNWATYFVYEIQEPSYPGIDIEKSTNGYDADTSPGPSITEGDPIVWVYVVTNTGIVTLNDVTVTDDQGITVLCPKTYLEVGEMMSCTASGVATLGQYTNVGTAIGTDSSLTTVQDSDPSNYYGISSASIGDFVWEDVNRNGIQDAGEPGLGGVTVILKDCSENLLATTVTNSNGFYQFFGLTSGNYYITFVAPNGYNFTFPDQGNDDAIDSDADPSTGASSCIAIAPGETNNTIDAGVVLMPN